MSLKNNVQYLGHRQFSLSFGSYASALGSAELDNPKNAMFMFFQWPGLKGPLAGNEEIAARIRDKKLAMEPDSVMGRVAMAFALADLMFPNVEKRYVETNMSYFFEDGARMQPSSLVLLGTEFYDLVALKRVRRPKGIIAVHEPWEAVSALRLSYSSFEEGLLVSERISRARAAARFAGLHYARSLESRYVSETEGLGFWLSRQVKPILGVFRQGNKPAGQLA